MKRTFAVPLLVALLCAAAPARAAVQTKGPELFPGKLQVGVNVIGFQAGFANFDTSGYKLTADFSGLIAPVKPGGIWLGGGLGYTAGFFGYCGAPGVVGGSCGGDFQMWAFVMLTLEKIVPIPLVPFVRAGIGGDVLFYGATGGAFVFRFGGGVHYYLLKWLGVGVETNFALGPGFYGNFGAPNGFYGHWDFLLGARFAF